MNKDIQQRPNTSSENEQARLRLSARRTRLLGGWVLTSGSFAESIGVPVFLDYLSRQQQPDVGGNILISVVGGGAALVGVSAYFFSKARALDEQANTQQIIASLSAEPRIQGPDSLV